MDTKKYKFFKLFSALMHQDISSNAVMDKYISEFLKLDYSLAEDVWEFLILETEDKLTAPGVAEVFIDLPLGKFYNAGITKICKTLSSRPKIRNAVFELSPTADMGNAFDLMINFLLTKPQDADAALACVVRNTAIKSTFGAYMKAVIERYFLELMKRSPDKTVNLKQKNADLLVGYVKRIKTDEKPLLLQRIKEVM